MHTGSLSRRFVICAVACGLVCGEALRTPRSDAAGRARDNSVEMYGMAAARQVGAAAGEVNIRESYGRLPLSFEPNRGQSDPEVKFISRGDGFTLWLTATGAVLASDVVPESLMRMEIAGARRQVHVSAGEQLPGTVNYIVGPDPRSWRMNIPTYAEVQYHDVYPGIDVRYYGRQRQLEYDFVVRPGADPDAIALRFEGAETVHVDADGELVVRLGEGEVRHRKPYVYQQAGGLRQEIGGIYEIRGGGEVGFRVEEYDPTRSLTIDPVLIYSSYLGGGLADGGDGEYLGIDVDAVGNAYVTGITKSVDFPIVPGAFDTTYSGGTQDVYVAKLNAAGSALVYSTYLGGGGRDYGTAIAVDASGEVYVTGGTTSGDFPTTPGAFDTTFGGADDAFVTKLNSAGSSLLYSTYLADSGGYGIAVDAAGNAYVTGGARTAGFPTTPGAFDRTFAGGDAFVTKLNPAGSALVYSTFLGGTGNDSGEGIVVDEGGNAYLSGYTDSADFSTTMGALDTSFGGGLDGFVARLNAAGSALVFATYVGGTGFDSGRDIALDGTGSVYVTGETSSIDFPTTVDAFDTSLGGSFDAFVTKLNGAGSSLIYSTYLGGSGDEGGRGVVVSGLDEAYITGATTSNDFPVTADAFDSMFDAGVDAFLTILSAAASTPTYSTYIGGSADDGGSGIAVDASGGAYVTGVAFSNDFPTTPGAFDTSWNGGGDIFVTKFANGAPNLQVSALKGKSVAAAGALYSAKDTTRNVGTEASAPTVTKFYLSQDGTWDADDIPLAPVSGRGVPGLPAGTSNTGGTMVTIPAGTATARHFIIAFADAEGVSPESNEADNTKAKAIDVGPDLKISKVTAPASASAGQTILVSDTTQSAGGAAVAVETVTQFYLSIDKKLDASDAPLGTGRTVPPLAASASDTASTNVTIPLGTSPRAYFILAKADNENGLVETRETNNVKAVPIAVN